MSKYIYVNSGITVQDVLNFKFQLPAQRRVDKYATVLFGDIDGFRRSNNSECFEHHEWVARGDDLFLVNSNTREEISVNFTAARRD